MGFRVRFDRFAGIGCWLEVKFDPFDEFSLNLKYISYHALRISFRSVPRLIFNEYNSRLDILSIDRGEERIGLQPAAATGNLLPGETKSRAARRTTGKQRSCCCLVHKDSCLF